MSSLPWTDDRVGQLQQLWSEGLSASEIARRLGGVTRNAVIGKLHRLGLLGSRSRVAIAPRAARTRRRPALRRQSRRAPRVAQGCPAVAAPDWPGEVPDVERLEPHQCRWPIGDPRAPDFSFCGRWAAVGPYCPAHRAVAFVPGSAGADERARS